VIGKALPGHFVGEGKLVLFLDEDIASCAPKRGKRRKDEAQRLKVGRKWKRQKTERPSSTGVADVIGVGGGPAEDPEPKSDPDDELDPNLTVDTSALRL
jgi:hypothetical protein